LCTNYLLKRAVKGKRGQKWKVREDDDVNSFYMTLTKEKLPEIEGGSTRSLSQENSL
jgi:hypothetical protein